VTVALLSPNRTHPCDFPGNVTSDRATLLFEANTLLLVQSGRCAQDWDGADGEV
jgi:hypothetical protein